MHVAACLTTVSCRLARTCGYVVAAAKCLALLHCFEPDGDPPPRHANVVRTLP